MHDFKVPMVLKTFNASMKDETKKKNHNGLNPEKWIDHCDGLRIYRCENEWHFLFSRYKSFTMSDCIVSKNNLSSQLSSLSVQL